MCACACAGEGIGVCACACAGEGIWIWIWNLIQRGEGFSQEATLPATHIHVIVIQHKHTYSSQ